MIGSGSVRPEASPPLNGRNLCHKLATRMGGA